MERLTFNAAAAKLVRKDGRDWRVAPMSIITPGVLAGSKGPLLYEPEECRNSVPEWDGTPITLFHPTDSCGTPVSAGHPNAKRIGHLANTRFDGKLRSVGWFDVEATRAADQELGTNVLWSLENGRSVELSTGLYTDNFPSKGVHKGRSYDFVARNYRADHLAVLPGMTGACSIGDGCGVLVNAQERDEKGRFAASGAHGVTQEGEHLLVPATGPASYSKFIGHAPKLGAKYTGTHWKVPLAKGEQLEGILSGRTKDLQHEKAESLGHVPTGGRAIEKVKSLGMMSKVDAYKLAEKLKVGNVFEQGGVYHVVTEIGKPSYTSRDMHASREGHPNGPGWHIDYKAVPIHPPKTTQNKQEQGCGDGG